MPNILSAAALAASFQAKHPSAAAPGILSSLDAAEGSIGTVQAMAVRGFNAPSAKLVWVKAHSHFFVSGELVQEGDYVEIEESDARRMVRNEQCEIVTQAEVDAAALGDKTKVGK